MPTINRNIMYPASLPFTKIVATVPDVYHQDGNKFNYPNDDFVISRDIKGNVLSRYRDLVYDLAPYASTKSSKTKIPFNLIEGESYKREAHWLWFICYRFDKNGRNKNNLSVGVLYSRFTGFVKPLCKFAKLNNVSTIYVLETKKLLAKFIYENDTAMFNKQALPSLRLYHQLKNKIGFSVALSDYIFDVLAKRAKQVSSNKQQTELIPPRLYGLWLKEALATVGEFENNAESISTLLHQLINERPPDKKAYSPTMRAKAWSNWIEESKLQDLAKSKQFLSERRKFVFYLSGVMLVCKGLIHFYSGMRDDEVLSLNYHCLQLDKVNHRPRARLIGNTTKYIGSKKQEQWVTSVEIERVIAVLQSIVKPIASVLDVTVELDFKKGETPCPLFLSTNYILSRKYRAINPLGKVKFWGAKFTLSLSAIWRNDLLRITEEDVKYLEHFEPERNWRQPEFGIGKIWHFKSHQFRRSLAVYSAQSGLVSIGSLQLQLKHLCQEITFYYGNGAERAGNIFNIESNNHMAHEFISQKPLADYTAWVWQILFSDEKLDGINGKVIERTIKADTPEKQKAILTDRTKTIKQFKNGQRAYAETPLGGCETTTPCDKKLMHNLTACIDCSKADLKPSKVARTIDSMTIFVDSLAPNSVEYRTERSELDELIALKKRMERN
ncbi:hypothetical protein FR932_03815 [Moritella marina ATCC 15381]|uniref:Integrase n=1 Tax=Moritella marina ATCC 15381 TaxID=1202962 RepID=A0A5J6WGC0_MORMI|nr:hypothetical protein [Moritella marina]QFI37016.1 hypothetical protein FR932_03815 [Moritella marina ATCC 15381]